MLLKTPARLELSAHSSSKLAAGAKEVRFIKICASECSYAALDNQGRVYTFGREYPLLTEPPWDIRLQRAAGQVRAWSGEPAVRVERAARHRPLHDWQGALHDRPATRAAGFTPSTAQAVAGCPIQRSLPTAQPEPATAYEGSAQRRQQQERAQ